MSFAGIKFVSKSELEERKIAAKEAQAAREERERVEAKARRREVKERAASGEAAWLAPALERRLGGEADPDSESRDHHRHHQSKKKKKKDHHRSHRDDERAPKKKKHRHKHHRSGGGSEAAPGSSGESSTSDDDERDVAGAPAASASTGDAPPPAGDTFADGGSGDRGMSDRGARGLDFMLRPPPGADAGEDIFGSAGPSAPARPPAAAEPPAGEASVTVRSAKELNPYARDGVDSAQWSREGAGLAGSEVGVAQRLRAAGSDGGASWEYKRILRAVEESAASGRPLAEVCVERFGDLSRLGEMERMAQGGAGQARRGGGAAHPHAHLRAKSARQREAERDGRITGRGGGKGGGKGGGSSGGGGFA